MWYWGAASWVLHPLICSTALCLGGNSGKQGLLSIWMAFGAILKANRLSECVIQTSCLIMYYVIWRQTRYWRGYIRALQSASLHGRHSPPATVAQEGNMERTCEADRIPMVDCSCKLSTCKCQEPRRHALSPFGGHSEFPDLSHYSQPFFANGETYDIENAVQ